MNNYEKIREWYNNGLRNKPNKYKDINWVNQQIQKSIDRINKHTTITVYIPVKIVEDHYIYKDDPDMIVNICFYRGKDRSNTVVDMIRMLLVKTSELNLKANDYVELPRNWALERIINTNIVFTCEDKFPKTYFRFPSVEQKSISIHSINQAILMDDEWFETNENYISNISYPNEKNDPWFTVELPMNSRKVKHSYILKFYQDLKVNPLEINLQDFIEILYSNIVTDDEKIKFINDLLKHEPKIYDEIERVITKVQSERDK